MDVGFDVISDLNLAPGDAFNWEGKSTSLYCIVAGNISNDLQVIITTLFHLSRCYHGVFYIAGALEYEGVEDIAARTRDLERLGVIIKNLAFLHNHVVIIDGVAIMGANCWSGLDSALDESIIDTFRYEDLSYLGKSVEKLQLHLDVKKIVVVTGSTPSRELLFGEEASGEWNLAPNMCLVNDTEQKVSHWVYGNYKKEVDITLHDINYVCNPSANKSPYWPHRISVAF